LTTKREEYLVVVIESSNVAIGKQLATAMVEELSHPARRLLVGVGNAFGATEESPSGIRHSYEQAREAVRVGIALGRIEGVITFDELGLLHWLYHLPPTIQADNAYLEHISTLSSYDRERNTELVKTLETYLDHGGSLVDTAAALYIHRNTLLHRLERIKELCSLDLRDSLQRLNLHAAVKSYWLHNRANSS
jgi:purine catabolism regulator